MTVRLLRRSALLALTLVIVVDAVAVLYALLTTSDVRIPGATIEVAEVPGTSLSADFSIEPLEALIAVIVLTGAVFVALRQIDRVRRR